MPTTLLARFVNAFWPERDSNDDSEDADFVPSRLDHSIRVAHGGGKTEAAREISDIQEQAAKQQHRDH